jgi:arsenate reductase-like glutaredoxin family protein
VVTLFHSPSISSSNRVLTVLKQSRANAVATATEDQASSTEPPASNVLAEFDLDIREEPPTEDQLKSILEYVGSQNAGEVVKGAQTDGEALWVFRKDNGAFVRPLVCYCHLESLYQTLQTC